MSGRSDLGTTTKWYVMGRWNIGDDTTAGDITAPPYPNKADATGNIAVDTFVAGAGRSLDRWPRGARDVLGEFLSDAI
ncbi:MAG TPA: hypothetical protein VGD71_34285 [Kribbella sp.]|jgi:hypothetical protein